jgi:eukaryotic-like serine/threonine-protein kinase
MEPQTGQLINNKYRLVRLIGDGGMGSVFEARHELLGTTVALKFLHTALSRRKGLVERFLQEAQVSARIKSAHVVHVQDVDRTSEGLAYMVMEYVEGTTLQELYEQLYRQGKRLTYGEAFHLMLQLMEGVGAAHRMGIVHRDLKPDNVMLTHDGTTTKLVKILDFGIAKLRASGEMDRGLTKPGVVMGTPEYMAPEQAFSADKVDARADIFSLGVMFYEMLAGRRPVGGENAMAIAAQYLEGNITQLRTLVPTIAPALGRAVHRAMASRPEARFDSVAEFRAALAPFAPEAASASQSDLTPPPGEVFAATAAASPPTRQERTDDPAAQRRVPKTLPGEDDEPKLGPAAGPPPERTSTPPIGGASGASAMSGLGLVRHSGVPFEPSEAVAPAPDAGAAPAGAEPAGGEPEREATGRDSFEAPRDSAPVDSGDDAPTTDVSSAELLLRLQAPSSGGVLGQVGQAGTEALPALGPARPQAEPEIEVQVLAGEHAAAAQAAAESAAAEPPGMASPLAAPERGPGVDTSEATPFPDLGPNAALQPPADLTPSPAPAAMAKGETAPAPALMLKGATAAEPALVLKGATAAVPDRPGGTVVASPYGPGGFQASAATPVAADALLNGFSPSPVPPGVHGGAGAIGPAMAMPPPVAMGAAARPGRVRTGPSLLSILLLAGGVAGAVVGGVYLANGYGQADEGSVPERPTRATPAATTTTTPTSTDATTTSTTTTDLAPVPTPQPTPRPTQPTGQPTGKPTTTTTSTTPPWVLPTALPTLPPFPFPMPGPTGTSTGTSTGTGTGTGTGTRTQTRRPKVILPAPLPRDH